MTELVLPDEQPVTVSALHRMRVKVTGEIGMHSREADRLCAALIHIDATLRLFDPATDPNDIQAVRCHSRCKTWFAHGEVTRRIYEACRKDGIIWPRQAARQAMADQGVSEAGSKIAQEIISTFAPVAASLT